MLSRRCWLWVVAASGTSVCAGCMRLVDTQRGSPLSPLMAPETVHLDIVTLHYPEEDAEIDRDLWQQVDEQQIPLDLRLRLQANGFRAGVLGSQLPANLEKRLKLTDKPRSAETKLSADELDRDSPVRQRSLQIRAGARTHIICVGEQQKLSELSVLTRGPDGTVAGKTYRKVAGLLVLRAYPDGDGRARVELTPEIEHGDPQRRFDPSEGVLRVDFGPAKETFESLRLETTLSPGQMVILASLVDRPGSLGRHYFSGAGSNQKLQKLLIVRLARTGYDDSFATDATLPTDAP